MAISYGAYNFDNLSALTRDLYVPKMVDNIFKSNVLTYRMLKKSNPFSGGKKVLQPIEYAEQDSSGGSQTMGWYSNAETLAVGDKDVFADAVYDWSQAFATIRITGKEELLNAGNERVIDLVEAKMKNSEKSIKKMFGTQLYSDNNGLASPSTSGADQAGVLGLQHIVAKYGSGDSTGNDTKMGGIERAGASGYTFWNAGHAKTIKGAGASSADITFNELITSTSTATTTSTATDGVDELSVGDSVYIQHLLRNAYGDLTIDNDKPTLILVSQVVFDAYEATLTDQKRFGASDKALADAGFTNLLYRGTPVVVDQQLSSTLADGMFMLNENYIGFRHHRKRNFAFEDYVKPVDADYAVGKILWMGALTCASTRMQGKILGLPSTY